MSRLTHSRLLAACSLLFCSIALAQAPKVTKIDPPNWWSNYPHSPMLLLTGENLSAATVALQYDGLRVARSEASADGHYLFIYLDEKSGTPPGTAHFHLQSASGTTSFDFPIAARLPLAGRAQGVNLGDVIYLLMPDRFADGNPANDKNHVNRADPHAYHGGDLQGVTDHLAYLHDLGVTTLWLTPWWKNDSNSADYHGYHVTNFYAVDEHFGTMKDLQEMVAAAHRQGMKVLMDYVVNHTGPNHAWAADPPTPTWFNGTPQHHLAPLYDFWPLVDPHATEAERAPVLDGWFADKLPDLNCDDPKLAEYLTDNALWWMEIAGIDGFRLDTFPYSSRSFWSKWHDALFHVYPHTFTVGEVSNPDPVVVSFFQGGRKEYDGINSGVTSVFDFPSMYTIRDVLLHGAPAGKFFRTLAEDSLYPDPADLVTFIGNHDNKRFTSEQGSDLQKLNAAASLLVTMRGIPQIYSGDEIAMDGGDDPDNRHDFPGGFPGDPQNAFTMAGRTPEQQAAFAHLKKLLHLRAEHRALESGSETDLVSTETTAAFLRARDGDRILVVLNSSASPQTVHIGAQQTPLADAHVLVPLDSAAPAQVGAAGIDVKVAPMTVSIYQVN